MPIDQGLLARLATFDTPTICNALELIDPALYLTGFTTRPLVAPFPDLAPVVGYARTATIRATHPNEITGTAARTQRIDYYEYIASGGPTPSIVVIQDLDGAETGFGAFWGEVQSTIHKALGSAAVVTDGSVRDIPQWAPGLQVLAGSLSPSHARVHLAGFGGQVRIAGMTVRSGDLVHADRHGAVVIPEKYAAEVPAKCELLARKEAVILDMAKAPGFTVEKLKAALARQDEIH